MKSSAVELKRQLRISEIVYSSHILGFARIGPDRELKFALEKYWRLNSREAEKLVYRTREKVCVQNWKTQIQSGSDYLTVGDFSFYDQVLSTLVLVGGLPHRFNFQSNNRLLDSFRAARGCGQNVAMEMKKWFNTNYHYMVPEYNSATSFKVDAKWLIEEIDLASLIGQSLKVCLVGPVTLLWLGKEHDGLLNKIELLPQLLEVYKEILLELKKKSINLVQIEEPVFCLDVPVIWKEALKLTYYFLPKYSSNLLLTTYFSFPHHTANFLFSLPVFGVHIDVTTNFQLKKLPKQTKSSVLSIGIIDGKNVWKSNITKSVNKVRRIQDQMESGMCLWISTSCSLLHIPHDLSVEKGIRRDVLSDLAFGIQKVKEVSTIKLSLRLDSNQQVRFPTETFNPRVSFYTEELLHKTSQFEKDWTKRMLRQQESVGLPLFPTTTVGSFPQTQKIRALRSLIRNNKIGCGSYIISIRTEISFIIAKQMSLGLDVLVHGEVERNDMVEYFGELLGGFVITKCGWVQSYGSRCTKPPIILGDVSFISPMSVYWFNQAQSLTTKPVKGMLTGPTTMLNWSFSRGDLPFQEVSLQLCNALKIELGLLGKTGTKVVQIDEPAIKEGLPLNVEGRQQYLNWVVKAFNVLTSSLPDSVQIHTHMCYSEIGDLIEAITKLGVDVISVEAARSNMLPVQLFKRHNYCRGMGFGMYDIHSPAVPSTAEIVSRIEHVITSVSPQLVWINPDCGLKTRTWFQVETALTNLVKAAKLMRIKKK